MKSLRPLLAMAAAVALLSACGGGSSDPALQEGTFIDGPVAGIEFSSASSHGVTDAAGHFSYQAGEEVAFRLGGLYLGSAVPDAAGLVTPLALLSPEGSVTVQSEDGRVGRLLRTLQTLDTNADLTDGIQISSQTRQQLTGPAHNLDLTSTATSDQAVEAAIGQAFTVSREEAWAHFQQSLDNWRGNSGDSASSGSTGSPGDSGATGTADGSGSTGAAGDTGSSGTTGGTGSTGSSGSTGGTTDSGATVPTQPTDISPAPAAAPLPPATDNPTGDYALLAWNDLGMHCMDGKDFSVFSILPPYNNLHAQLIDRSTNREVTTGVTLTYEAVADGSGSINSSSAGKTNFWDYAYLLFGENPAPDYGLNLDPAGPSNPVANTFASAAPRVGTLAYNSATGWWAAEGIPMTPYPDDFAVTGVKNYYPMVKVAARDAAGNVLAVTEVVLPVSDELTCAACHATNASTTAARPAAGWVNDVDPEKDWKRNILRLHDERFPDAIATAGLSASYPGGSLLATADGGIPVLCAGCHASNALLTPVRAGIAPLTTALHSVHAHVTDPATGVTLDNSASRDACYFCHPGAKTQCLRGAMGSAKDANGNNLIDCQSCHGTMSDVGAAGREGWLDEPTCQGCHDLDAGGSFTRYTSVFAANGQARTVASGTFATNTAAPSPGYALYRFSKGHGDLQCEACHGATHAIYPSSHAGDNVQSIALQGYAGTISDCTICHSSMPATVDGGPHGMHTVGQDWISAHRRADKSHCAECHGSTSAGGIAATFTARSFQIEGRTKTFAAGTRITCWSCHNGPSGD